MEKRKKEKKSLCDKDRPITDVNIRQILVKRVWKLVNETLSPQTRKRKEAPPKAAATAACRRVGPKEAVVVSLSLSIPLPPLYAFLSLTKKKPPSHKFFKFLIKKIFRIEFNNKWTAKVHVPSTVNTTCNPSTRNSFCRSHYPHTPWFSGPLYRCCSRWKLITNNKVREKSSLT